MTDSSSPIEAERTALADEMHAAFHSESVARKNIALRKAYDALRAPRREGDAEPVAWQYRVMFDKGSARELEWCEWRDAGKKYYDKICAEIAVGATRVQARALYAHPASQGGGGGEGVRSRVDREGSFNVGAQELDDRPIPKYGQIPWRQLGRDIIDAITGRRDDYVFDETYYPGHQMVPGINFNSLARIVDKYRYYGECPSPSPSRAAAQPGEEFKPIRMQDVRLVAGEGRLPAWAVLDACNAILRQRAALAPARANEVKP